MTQKEVGGVTAKNLASGRVEKHPIVGAIRWDAWIGDVPGYDVGLQVERSLGPEQWRARLPFFATVASDGTVHVRANTPAIMDREIAYASEAGFDYWAFVMYARDNPQTTQGIDLYLNSRHRAKINFAMILQSYTTTSADIERLIGYFKGDSYQTVAGGRPLVFSIGPSSVDDDTWENPRDAFERLRKRAIESGVATPYIVHLWGWSGAQEVVESFGLDAISAYSMNFDDRAAPYRTLATKTEQKWDEWRATGKSVVPLVTTGWDRRPRVENPVSWEGATAKPDAIEYYYAAPTPSELSRHLGAAIDWCTQNPSAARANTILIYAWNEFDEGGWLTPSLWPEVGTERLDAIRKLLQGH